MSSLTIEQLYTYHAQDREIFSKLVLKFLRDPAESLLVMATWFWLEDCGFENIFSTIYSLQDPLLVAFTNEAVSIYQCLTFPKPPPNEINMIPLTSQFMKKQISLPLIYKNRYSAIVGIKNFLNTICSRIFTDILQRVLPPPPPSFFLSNLRHPLIIPGFPHPTFGNINVMMHDVEPSNMFRFPNELWTWDSTSIASENDRTMFITFSRGFPVSQEEVRQLFTEMYGENCVQEVYMPESSDNSPSTSGNGKQHSLWARLVLDSVVTVDRILEGESLKKFRINGKDIRARKYNEKRDEHV